MIVKPLGAEIWRWSAETMPAVTVRSRPKGLPIATTGSPTSTLARVAERERVELVRRARRPRSTAMSVESSLPTTLGARRLVIVVAERHLRSASAPVDDVGVGDDVAVVVDDEAGAGRALPPARAAERVEERGPATCRLRASMNATPGDERS